MKIIVSFALIVFVIFRDNLFVISSALINFAITFLCVAVTIFSILCIYISAFELYYVRENRRKPNLENLLTKPFPLERVISLVKENDIIEFEIKTNDAVLKIGAGSDCKISDSVFFDKRFFIGKDEYSTSAEFEKELFQYCTNGTINVITIDGIKADKW